MTFSHAFIYSCGDSGADSLGAQIADALLFVVEATLSDTFAVVIVLALLLAGFYLLTETAATILLIYTNHLTIKDAAFEAFSALGTVGLTRDLTPNLSAAGKWIDIVLMFAGRVLYPTFVMWMIRGRRESPDPVPWA